MKKMMKKGIGLSVVVAFLLVFFLMGGYSTLIAEAEVPETNKGEINVNGTGVLMVKPDIGIINIGIETSDPDSKKAQEENSKLSQQIMEALKASGIKEEDIKTAYYNMYREQYYNSSENKPQQGDFKVSHSFEVTVKDIDKVGSTVDTAVSAGANNINQIRFTVSNTEKYYNEALKLAVNNAAGKASTIAETLGVTISKPMKVTESGYSEPTYNKYMDVRMEAAMDSTPITAGELEIRAHVSVTYGY
ncbi:SIMPL domain-containing protein [Alkaliphilus serpentinus]|uniref:DUF541 domain-containing protein n=1 Tax=Alkaliphilus serpentinus TaxID=1482731 RepID=A0A833HM71_9FIRM|nr:SIMPL domain-containing protein [Alkaliphilus serpentinus]KAB3527258.1 DUF541 domain-containing protein [Alkaliphilus serpentinus]